MKTASIGVSTVTAPPERASLEEENAENAVDRSDDKILPQTGIHVYVNTKDDGKETSSSAPEPELAASQNKGTGSATERSAPAQNALPCACNTITLHVSSFSAVSKEFFNSLTS